ncbi:uncharacterized protein BDR25DRAFT_356843 [Lindgomyces ingoldianus]|uniref:Uncharacterized protein n=1 Tax=Lindgomyces ingoldianus TaxID=673940 RepID=A0ACB6QRC7_9PLEO|nr:uncharacterized protein BDR25DRAFT_356843 [Lindgomyces ingoldianus]KAF2469075.1 hypothetical protein BDR25DRAFT_356843 [Lindgomyces ingoldianus]
MGAPLVIRYDSYLSYVSTAHVTVTGCILRLVVRTVGNPACTVVKSLSNILIRSRRLRVSSAHSGAPLPTPRPAPLLGIFVEEHQRFQQYVVRNRSTRNLRLTSLPLRTVVRLKKSIFPSNIDPDWTFLGALYCPKSMLAYTLAHHELTDVPVPPLDPPEPWLQLLPYAIQNRRRFPRYPLHQLQL